jgi:hypothetical protein
MYLDTLENGLLKQLSILGQSKFGWAAQLIRNNFNISGANTDSRDNLNMSRIDRMLHETLKKEE